MPSDSSAQMPGSPDAKRRKLTKKIRPNKSRAPAAQPASTLATHKNKLAARSASKPESRAATKNDDADAFEDLDDEDLDDDDYTDDDEDNSSDADTADVSDDSEMDKGDDSESGSEVLGYKNPTPADGPKNAAALVPEALSVVSFADKKKYYGPKKGGEGTCTLSIRRPGRPQADLSLPDNARSYAQLAYTDESTGNVTMVRAVVVQAGPDSSPTYYVVLDERKAGLHSALRAYKDDGTPIPRPAGKPFAITKALAGYADVSDITDNPYLRSLYAHGMVLNTRLRDEKLRRDRQAAKALPGPVAKIASVDVAPVPAPATAVGAVGVPPKTHVLPVRVELDIVINLAVVPGK